MDDSKSQSLLEETSAIVAAFVSKNKIPSADLSTLIVAVYQALLNSSSEIAEPEAPQAPAVSVRRSITSDYLICLEDGLKYRSLKRHLRTQYGMTPEDYRSKWGLPKDYPMVAPNYAAIRSALAKNLGLGQLGRKSPGQTSARGKRGKAAG